MPKKGKYFQWKRLAPRARCLSSLPDHYYHHNYLWLEFKSRESRISVIDQSCSINFSTYYPCQWDKPSHKCLKCLTKNGIFNLIFIKLWFKIQNMLAYKMLPPDIFKWQGVYVFDSKVFRIHHHHHRRGSQQVDRQSFHFSSSQGVRRPTTASGVWVAHMHWEKYVLIN